MPAALLRGGLELYSLQSCPHRIRNSSAAFGADACCVADQRIATVIAFIWAAPAKPLAKPRNACEEADRGWEPQGQNDLRSNEWHFGRLPWVALSLSPFEIESTKSKTSKFVGPILKSDSWLLERHARHRVYETDTLPKLGIILGVGAISPFVQPDTSIMCAELEHAPFRERTVIPREERRESPRKDA